MLLGESDTHPFFLAKLIRDSRSRHILCYDMETGQLEMSNIRTPGRDNSYYF
jgi:hypothetical protein